MTGVGRYLGELLRRWIGTARRGDAAIHSLLATSRSRCALPPDITETRVIPGGAGTWWEQTTLRAAVRRDKPDVFFAPAYTAPVALGIPFAVTIHDVSFLAHPEWFRARERWRRRLLAHRMAASASVIFTDSEFSRSEISSRLRVDATRLKVIRPGLTGPAAARSVPANTLAREPLVLYVGTLLNRRNLPEAIAAFAKATEGMPEARFVIVGGDRTWPPQDLTQAAAAFGVSARVDLRSYLPHDQLRDHYLRASVFVFLSEYEGFGLTPLEALAAGVPIVVLDTPIAREVYGDAAEYVGIGDIEGAAAAIRHFLESRPAAHTQLLRATEVLARYSWDRAADDTLHEIERIRG